MIGRHYKCESSTWDGPQCQYVRCVRWLTHPGTHEGHDRDGNVLVWANTDPIPTGHPGRPTATAHDATCDSADSGKVR